MSGKEVSENGKAICCLVINIINYSEFSLVCWRIHNDLQPLTSANFVINENCMDDKMFNMSEAFIKMTESFLRIMKAVKDAKSTIDNMLRLQYREAGYPFGESEEGLLLWRDKLSEDYAMFCENDASCDVPGRAPGLDHEEVLYLPEQFSSLKDEVTTRIN